MVFRSSFGAQRCTQDQDQEDSHLWDIKMGKSRRNQGFLWDILTRSPSNEGFSMGKSWKIHYKWRVLSRFDLASALNPFTENDPHMVLEKNDNGLTVLSHWEYWWLRGITPLYCRIIQVSEILWFTHTNGGCCIFVWISRWCIVNGDKEWKGRTYTQKHMYSLGVGVQVKRHVQKLG